MNTNVEKVLHFGVRGHGRALKAATCRRIPKMNSCLFVLIRG